jgi:hypothetical protein
VGGGIIEPDLAGTLDDGVGCPVSADRHRKNQDVPQ